MLCWFFVFDFFYQTKPHQTTIIYIIIKKKQQHKHNESPLELLFLVGFEDDRNEGLGLGWNHL